MENKPERRSPASMKRKEAERKKKKRKKRMQKMIPFFVAIVLIIVIGLIGFGTFFLEKYSYSKEETDFNKYFNLNDDSEVAIRLMDDLCEEKGKLIDGVYYLPLSFIKENLNNRLYYDDSEGFLLYTTPTDIIRNEIGSSDYFISEEKKSEQYPLTFLDGEQLYVAVDYVKKYTNFGCETFADPNHMQITNVWDTVKTAGVKKDTQIRVQGGVKSDVLEQVSKGDRVIILEEMETWTKVRSNHSFVGYIENKRLEDFKNTVPEKVNDVEEPVYTSVTRNHKINMAFHQVFVQDANAYLTEALANTSGINVIAPTWFTLSDNEGDFSSFASNEYVKNAHDRGMEVWAVIDNINQPVDTDVILSSTTKRQKIISSLIQIVQEYDIDGINVDFEQISGETGDDFIEFIRELSIPCRENGIVLSIDNYVPREYTNHYQRKEQGIVADYVVIMGYDEYYAGSEEAGSVASIDFVEDGIAKTVEEVPSNKVINAVPFYTRVWTTKDGTVKSEAVGMQTAKDFLEKNNVTAVWDEKTCQNYAEFETNSGLYQIWLEDAQSLEVRLNVMKNYNLGGVAEWKLGFETQDVWVIIESYLNS